MAHKVFSQAEFDALPRDENGWKYCPTGDYTQVKEFGAWCSFGTGCSFGERCRFGEECRFGGFCRFGACCSFGIWCSFGTRCSFDTGCRFGEGCRFGAWCRFGTGCSFGKGCSFGECCRFGRGCSHEGLTNSVYFACDRIGSERRKTYFFCADEGYFVRAGCFFGTLDDFVKRVKDVHAGTQYEREYLAAVELAKIVLGTEE